MTNQPDDERSLFAKSAAWGSQVTSASLEMVLPAMGGYWIDQKLGTKVLFLLLGLALGITVGMMHLIRLANVIGKATSKKK